MVHKKLNVDDRPMKRRHFLTHMALAPAWPSLLSSCGPDARTSAIAAEHNQTHLVFNQRIRNRNPIAVVSHAWQAWQGWEQDRLGIRVLAGGHGYLGNGIIDGGRVIDLRKQRQITRMGISKIHVEAGARFVDLYRALQTPDGQLSYFLPTGNCPTVGLAGYTLGGGYGHLSRWWGPMCDHVLGMTVTVAPVHGPLQTRYIHADAPGDGAELFWALRGSGGARFGVVHDFIYQLQPVPEGIKIYDLHLRRDLTAEQITAALSAWCQWGKQHVFSQGVSSQLAFGRFWYHIAGLATNSVALRELVVAMTPWLDQGKSRWDLPFKVNHLTQTFKQCVNLEACEQQSKASFAARSAFMDLDELNQRCQAICEQIIVRQQGNQPYGGLEVSLWRLPPGNSSNNAFAARNHDSLVQFYTSGSGDEAHPWMQAMFAATTGRAGNDLHYPAYVNYLDKLIPAGELGFPDVFYGGGAKRPQHYVDRLQALQARYRNPFHHG
jgi:hypothetical protein